MKATWTCENAWQRWVVVASGQVEQYGYRTDTDTAKIPMRHKPVEQTSNQWSVPEVNGTLQLPVCCSQEFLGW